LDSPGDPLAGCRKSVFWPAVGPLRLEAGFENKPVIAALKRGATPKRARDRVFHSLLEPARRLGYDAFRDSVVSPFSTKT
jgi:hypothetical protein